MRRVETVLLIFLISGLAISGWRQENAPAAEPHYTVAFFSNAPLNIDIFIADSNGSNPRPIVSHPDLDYNASFSRDGRWIIFTSHRAGSADIYRVHPDGSGLERLTDDPAFDDQAALSPDGTLLAFVSTRSGQADIWVLDLATGASSNLTDHPAGDRIAFGLGTYFGDGSQVAHLAVINSDGTGLKMLTEGERNDGFPSWAPDGSRLVFRSGRSRARGLAIIDVETGQITPLTSGSHNDNFPVWSPLGDLIAFTSDRDGDYEIYTIRPDGADLKRLTRQPGNDAHCAWSPDGKWIAFSSARGGFKDEAPLSLPQWNPQPYGEVCVMRADGSDVRALTDDQYEDGGPTFVPTPGLRLKDDY